MREPLSQKRHYGTFKAELVLTISPALDTLVTSDTLIPRDSYLMAIPKRKPSSPSVEDLARELVDEPDKWLDTENDQLGGEKPRALIGTPKEPMLRNLLEAIRDGSFS